MNTIYRVERDGRRGSAPSVPAALHLCQTLARSPLRYQLSIEHAAWLTQLKEQQMVVVLCVGAAMSDAEIARYLGVSITRAKAILQTLKIRTRMRRMELAVMGYLWRATYTQQQLAVASA